MVLHKGWLRTAYYNLLVSSAMSFVSPPLGLWRLVLGGAVCVACVCVLGESDLTIQEEIEENGLSVIDRAPHD